MKRVEVVRHGLESCDCILRSSCGLPCACRLLSYVQKGVPVPLNAIDVFWKKLNFEPALLVVNDEEDEEEEPTVGLNHHFQDFEEAFKKEKSSTVKRSWLQKLRGIWDPNSTTYDEPKVQTKTRGRPNKPTQPPLQRTYSNKPGRYSTYEASRERDFDQQPRRHSSFRYASETSFDPPVDPPVETPIDPHVDQHTQQSNFWESSSSYNQNTFPNDYTSGPTEYDFFQSNPHTHDYTSGPTEYDFFQSNQHTYDYTSGPTEYDFFQSNQQNVGDQSNQHNVEDEKSHDYKLYIGQIPEVFRTHVKDIKNVVGDGNCGFRATAIALGYREDDWLKIRKMLIQEMKEFKDRYIDVFGIQEYNDIFHSLNWKGKGFAPFEYWMRAPDTGYVIANKFNVIYHNISPIANATSTIFPLWRGPEEFPEKKIISIAFVDGAHFVMVELDGEFPLALTHTLWRYKKWPTAENWQWEFMARQREYEASLPSRKTEVHEETID